ncbi:MAG: hypothetical protein ABI672_00815 [Vicinamibacteria bacterium]
MPSPRADGPLFFDINHPVQALMFRPVIEEFRARGRMCRVFARDKDVTLGLLDRFGIKAELLAARRRGWFGAAIELLAREQGLLRRALRDRPLAIIGTTVHAARVGRLSNAVSIVVNDDNAETSPLFARIAYPFADLIVKPRCMAFEGHRQQVTFRANQQLFYLHPSRFQADPHIHRELGLAPEQRFAMIRLAAHDAHHDKGVNGLRRNQVREIAARIPKDVVVFVSLEKEMPLPEGWRPFRLAPDRLHHALAAAEFFLGDGQSVTAEAAVLGTPALRFTEFAGRISYLNELGTYGLTWGFKRGQERDLLDCLDSVLAGRPSREELRASRERFLADTIDPLPWLIDLVTSATTDLVARGSVDPDLAAKLRPAFAS